VSILLEALRKSEKSQRPVAPPGIHDAVPEVSTSRRSGLGPVLLLLLAGLLLTGWFTWRQYRPVVVEDQPPVVSSVAHKAPVSAPVAGAPADGVTTPGSSQRTPVESYTDDSNPRVATAGTPPVAAASAPIPTPAPGINLQSPAKQPVVAGEPLVAATGSHSRSQEDEYQPDEPAPISYWELPDAVRVDVPEIKFSVLVYSSKPDERFILVNGQRLTEGDSLPSGPKVAEIRLDGVVFSYQLYRFLVER